MPCPNRVHAGYRGLHSLLYFGDLGLFYLAQTPPHPPKLLPTSRPATRTLSPKSLFHRNHVGLQLQTHPKPATQPHTSRAELLSGWAPFGTLCHPMNRGNGSRKIGTQKRRSWETSCLTIYRNYLSADFMSL